MRLAFVIYDLNGLLDRQSLERWNNVLMAEAQKQNDKRYIGVAEINNIVFRYAADEEDQISKIKYIANSDKNDLVKAFDYDQEAYPS